MKKDLNIFSAAGAKFAAFSDRINLWQSGKPVPPITVEIQPTEQCNHSCPHCQGHFALSQADARLRATRGEHIEISSLDTFWHDPPNGVVLSGNTGDPLLYPRIEELIDALYRYRIPTVLITNGEAFTSKLAKKALAACRGIRISLDAYDAASFERTHGRPNSSWLNVLDSIQLLIWNNRRAGLHCSLGIGYLTGRNTASGMLPATALARELGVDYIQFRPFHFDSTDVGQEILECRKLEDQQFRVLASDQKYGRFNNQERGYDVCHGSWFFNVIDARSDVYICCHHIGRPKARIGSLRSLTWKELISSARRQAVIARFPAPSCVPLCRLHAHNEYLERVRSAHKSFSPEPIQDEIAYHAMFL